MKERRTVLITGCSSGIGEAAVRLFSKKNWRVAATMRTPDNKLADFPNVDVYRLDVTDTTSVEDAVNRAIQNLSKIDVVVNNAGLYETRPLEDSHEEDIQKLIDTNIMGTIRVIRAILPHFRNMGGGTIVNVSSLAGRITLPFQSVYHSSKWGIEGLSETLRYELKDLDIHIRLVEPGMVKTPLYESTFAHRPESSPEPYQNRYAVWRNFLLNTFNDGYPPEREAKTIYAAATSSSAKLRYHTDMTSKIVLLLRRILPDFMFYSIVQRVTGI